MKRGVFIDQPLSIAHVMVTRAEVRKIIDGLANVPEVFVHGDLLCYAPVPPNSAVDLWWQKKLISALLARWKELGLIYTDNRRDWRLYRGAWAKFQEAVSK